MRKKILILLFFVFWAVPALAEMIVDTAWVRRYNGPGNDWDWASAIAVDGSGNVYVTGTSFVSWPFIGDYATIKYYPNGDTAWVRRYNGPGDSTDYALTIAVDGSGNVYVTGGSGGTGTSTDYSTIGYYPTGDTAWVRRYNEPGNVDDYATAIAIDDSNNVHVTGESYGDYATIRYHPNGDTAWVRRYNGPGDSTDYARAIAIDGSGNVYVTGGSFGSGTSLDYATVKYYPNGDTAWVIRYNGLGDSTDYALAIAIDGSNNVYVTGGSFGSGTSLDYVTVKYYPNGDTAWVRRYDGPGNYVDRAYAIAVDGSNNVYVTGESYGSGTSFDYATIKYYPNGDTAWVRRYNGPGNFGDIAEAIAVDDSGNVYVTGSSVGSGTDDDYATIKYYPDGDTVWVRRYDGPGNIDQAYAIAVDGSNNVYVTGQSGGDYATIKYSEALRGDANGDGEINLADAVYLVNYLFIGGPAPEPLEAGDANCDGEVDLADAVYIINYLFIGGPPPEC